MSPFGRRRSQRWVAPAGRGRYVVRLPPEVRIALVHLVDGIIPALEDPSANPSLHRLFPPAHREDVLAEAAWQIEQGGALADSHRAHLDMVRQVGDEPIDQETLLAWMQGLNALRMVLAERLGAGDAEAEHDAFVAAGIAAESLDPTVAEEGRRIQLEISIYELLAMLVNETVDALSDAL